MLHKLMIAVLGAVAGMFSTAALAQGTAVEAKAMLEEAVAAVKADKAKALDMFNKGEGGFLDRNLYVFCSNVSDGKLLADGNPNAKRLIGTDDRTLKGLDWQGIRPRSLCCGAEARRSNHRGQLLVSKAGS